MGGRLQHQHILHLISKLLSLDLVCCSLLTQLILPHHNPVTACHSLIPSLTHSHSLTDQVSLKYFEEAFTSAHWMMRVYRVRDQPNRDTPKDSGRAAARTAKKSKA